jgi:hypothetical protein
MRRYYYANRDKELTRQRRSYHEQKARDANAVAAPGKGESSNRKKVDAAHQQGQQ